MAADVYVLLRARLPEGVDAQAMTGAVSGVLAHHGALGTHETMLGDVQIELVSCIAADASQCDTVMAHCADGQLRPVPGLIYSLLSFDARRTPHHPLIKSAINALAKIATDPAIHAEGLAARVLSAYAAEVRNAQVQG